MRMERAPCELIVGEIGRQLLRPRGGCATFGQCSRPVALRELA
jgi:hypothetical protein